jgi:hypothetical protein
VACGAALAQVLAFDVRHRHGAVTGRSAEVRMALRLEPRVQPPQIGTTLVAWTSVEDGFGRKVPWTEAANRQSDVTALALNEVPEQFTGATLTGELLVQTLEPVTLTATIRPGDKARADLLGQEVSMQLIGEGETTPNGQRGPGFSVSVPTAVLGTRPKLSVTLGGQPLKFNNQGSHWSGGRIELFYRGPKLLDGAYVATLTGQAALQQVRMPLTVPIALGARPAAAPRAAGDGLDLQVATRVQWAAGPCTVGEAVTRLGGANQVLLELGADERRSVELPAFDGTFWEAVLTICRAYDLTILPPSQAVQAHDDDGEQEPTCITGGPLCLGPRLSGRRAIETFQASGILLIGLEALTVVSNHGLGGVLRQAEVSYRLRLEPRLDAALVGSATVSWASLAGVSDGQPLVVEESTPEVSDDDDARMQMRVMRVGGRLVRVAANEPAGMASASGRVVVSGLPAGQVPLQLAGQVALTLRRPVRAEFTLAPGERTAVRLGHQALMVKLFRNSAEEDSSERSGVSVEMSGDAIDALTVDVRDAAGKAVRSNGSGNSGSSGRTRLLWYLANVEQGPYTVVLAGRERLGVLRLPFALSTATP